MPSSLCAICQGGRESTGGSFILALLTPCSDRCSWRPAESRGGGETKKKPHISPQPHILRALPRVTPSTPSRPQHQVDVLHQTLALMHEVKPRCHAGFPLSFFFFLLLGGQFRPKRVHPQQNRDKNVRSA